MSGTPPRRAMKVRTGGRSYAVLLGRPGPAEMYRTDRGEWERLDNDGEEALRVAAKAISLRRDGGRQPVRLRSTTHRGNLLQRMLWRLITSFRRLSRSLTFGTSTREKARR